MSSTGFIDNKVIETDDPLSREELNRASNYLNQNFAGATLVEIRERMIALMEDERAALDALLKNAIDLAQRGLPADQGPEVLVDGAETLLVQPELSDLQTVQRMFDAFSDRARLVSMLNLCIAGQGVRVWIGDESDLTSELDFSLVVTPYRAGVSSVGSLGVFGPSRMPYSRMIPLVNYLGERVSEALEQVM